MPSAEEGVQPLQRDDTEWERTDSFLDLRSSTSNLSTLILAIPLLILTAVAIFTDSPAAMLLPFGYNLVTLALRYKALCGHGALLPNIKNGPLKRQESSDELGRVFTRRKSG